MIAAGGGGACCCATDCVGTNAGGCFYKQTEKFSVVTINQSFVVMVFHSKTEI